MVLNLLNGEMKFMTLPYSCWDVLLTHLLSCSCGSGYFGSKARRMEELFARCLFKRESWAFEARSLQEPHGRCSAVSPGLASGSCRGIGRTGDASAACRPSAWQPHARKGSNKGLKHLGWPCQAVECRTVSALPSEIFRLLAWYCSPYIHTVTCMHAYIFVGMLISTYRDYRDTYTYTFAYMHTHTHIYIYI